MLRGEKGDAVIIGPRSLGQLDGYVEAVERGALPAELVEKLDGLWEIVEKDAKEIVEY